MEHKKTNECQEVNSKTKLGLTLKEFLWIISLVVGIGYLYADVKNEMTNIKVRIENLENRQNINEKELQERRESDSENYQKILLELQTIRGDLKLKQDRYK